MKCCETIECRTLTIGNIVWKLVFQMESEYSDPTADIVAELSCRYEYRESNLWSINAEVELIVEISGTEVKKSVDYCFNNSSITLNFGIIAETPKYPFSERVRITSNWVSIDIKNKVGMDFNELTDFKIPKNDDTEVVLPYIGNKLYVDRNALMCIESKFRDEILSSDSEFLDEITCVDYHTVVYFLQLLHQQNPEIIIYDVEDLLTLAKQYNIQFLFAYCEDYLISTGFLTTREKLQQAERYQFSKLQTHAMDELTEEDIDYFCFDKCKMSKSILNAVLLRKLEVVLPDNEKKTKSKPYSLNSFRFSKIIALLISIFCYTCMLIYFAA